MVGLDIQLVFFSIIYGYHAIDLSKDKDYLKISNRVFLGNSQDDNVFNYYSREYLQIFSYFM
jgi:hypothetical protein